jgi:N-ethylmaleimide reductase
MSNDLFSPYSLGDLQLPNRLVMAPMTRNRADQDDAPHELTVTYYTQRASAGLIITEGSPVARDAVGYPATPGIYSDKQIAGWKAVTDAVHAEGGRIFIQLWHCGRISHPSLLPDNALPVAPSAIKPEGQAFTYTGLQDFVEPQALSVDDIKRVVQQFQQAAAHARAAGFDGVEVHGANGYLIDQFLRDGSNRRDDAYGGSLENRLRFLNEILDAVCEEWPANRVGLRLTPENSFNDMSDSDPQSHFEYFVSELKSRGLAYLHILEGDMTGKAPTVNYRALRDTFGGTYIANNGYDKQRAITALAQGDCDLVAFGVPFLANPDLVHRLQQDVPLNPANQDTFYGGGAEGYTDYPFAD